MQPDGKSSGSKVVASRFGQTLKRIDAVEYDNGPLLSTKSGRTKCGS